MKAKIIDFKPIEIVSVKYCRHDEMIKMGRLALNNRKIYFEYDAEFLKNKLELSPFKLGLRSGVIACEDNVFEGLFGIFNDSLPDGWGRLLLDRKLIQMGINPVNITPLDRLCYVVNGVQVYSARCHAGRRELLAHRCCRNDGLYCINDDDLTTM